MIFTTCGFKEEGGTLSSLSWTRLSAPLQFEQLEDFHKLGFIFYQFIQFETPCSNICFCINPNNSN